MERRTYLGSLGTVGITSVAGCLGDLLGGDSNPDTILEPPEEEAQYGDYSYQTYGEEFPSFSLTDPIAEEAVSRDDFVGERPFVITYFMDPVRMACVTRSSSTSLGYRKTPSRAATRTRSACSR